MNVLKTIFRKLKSFSRESPPFLLMVMGFLLVIPFWSLVFVQKPPQGLLSIGLSLAVYWGLPFILIGLLVTRHFLFIPLFVLQIVGLIAGAVLAMHGKSHTQEILRIVLLVTGALLTLFISNREMDSPYKRPEICVVKSGL